MPTGTPYNSFIAPYRIRVDDFASISNTDPEATPLLHLLTHTHSDHINGLSAKSFGYNVICSHDAKEMLLNHQVQAERDLDSKDLRAEKKRTYSHLRIEPMANPNARQYYNGSRDLLRPLPLNTPTQFELDANNSVTITLLDANHCPGSVMFLVEGDRGAVLHTGDFRAEPWFLESITRNPILQPYLSPTVEPQNDLSTESMSPVLSRSLEAIYLDTACVMSKLKIPTKADATAGLIELMKLLPSSTYFYINSWTWGYEDILKAIAREFQSKIHVDAYKSKIYQRISDPFLHILTTEDEKSTRFHACERFSRCDFVSINDDDTFNTEPTSAKGKHVVYINPVNMEHDKWMEYCREIKNFVKSGQKIYNLLVPLSRHSSLPELQEFVKLFRPKRVVPNTLDPRLFGLDWACINAMFSTCISPPHSHVSDVFPTSQHLGILGKHKLSEVDQIDGDVDLKNLIGANTHSIAKKWVDHQSIISKFKVIRDYVSNRENDMIDQLLGIARPRGRHPLEAPSSDPPQYLDKGKGRQIIISRYHDKDSDDDTEDSHDERGRTADFLFGAQAGINIHDKENSWLSSEASQEGLELIENVEHTNVILPIKGKQGPAQDGAWRLNCLTPESSPVQKLKKASGSSPTTPTPMKQRPPVRRAGPGSISNPSSRHILTPKVNQPVRIPNNANSGGSHSFPICLVSSSPEMSFKSRSNGLSHSSPTTNGPINGRISGTPPEPSSRQAVKRKITTSFKASIEYAERSTISSHSNANAKRRKLDPVLSTITSKREQKCAKPPATPSAKHHTRPLLQSHSTIPFIPSENEQQQRERIRTSDNLAMLYPDRVDPSYPTKRTKQLARMERKRQTPANETAVTSNSLLSTPRRQFLLPVPTILDMDI
ncbi:Protein artemis [Psilocybe cubensis]|uniref:Protein artemis n=2 Tax=Psilocybe cubensis TaxID=181762 RepID=A0ACB8GYE7_PSICU|nr:Protein artemis [Psilocybe cubensis]KAH9480452.1 Protein artemis [Psilocybe cubensis]